MSTLDATRSMASLRRAFLWVLASLRMRVHISHILLEYHVELYIFRRQRGRKRLNLPRVSYENLVAGHDSCSHYRTKFLTTLEDNAQIHNIASRMPTQFAFSLSEGPDCLGDAVVVSFDENAQSQLGRLAPGSLRRQLSHDDVACRDT
jgi:hypothetical protein